MRGGGGARRPGPVCGLLWAASSPDPMILSRGATCPSACKALSGRGYPQPSPAAPRPRRGDSRSLPSRGPGRPQPLWPCPSSRVSSRALCCVFPDGVTFTGPACAAGRAPVGAEPQLRMGEAGQAHAFLPKGRFFFICSKKGKRCEATEVATRPLCPGRGEAGRRRRGRPRTQRGQTLRKVLGSARLCGFKRA